MEEKDIFTSKTNRIVYDTVRSIDIYLEQVKKAPLKWCLLKYSLCQVHNKKKSTIIK